MLEWGASYPKAGVPPHAAGYSVPSDLERIRHASEASPAAAVRDDDVGITRHYPRQEPSAVVPLAGIRAGGGSTHNAKTRPYRDPLLPLGKTPQKTKPAGASMLDRSGVARSQIGSTRIWRYGAAILRMSLGSPVAITADSKESAVATTNASTACCEDNLRRYRMSPAR